MSTEDGNSDRRQFLREAATIGVALSSPMLTAERAAAQNAAADLTAMTASQLSAAIRGRAISCVDVMRAYLERIHRFNPLYNAIVALRDDAALLADAAASDAALRRGDYRGWMHGLPHAVKDLANAAGLPTSRGSRIYAGTVATVDDIHVARMRAAGAIFIGKTNVPELGTGSQTYNDVFGTTRNAYDPALTAGGSSGGAAVGLAAQMLPVADGSDMMGSLRNPAAFNNVVGFRPSLGRVPRTPSDLFYNQLSVNGPMGRNVEDTVRLLATIAGYDGRAPLSLRDDVPVYEAFRAARLAGLRIGWLGDFGGYLATETGVLELCESALETLAQQGVVVESVQPDYPMGRLWQAWVTLRHWSHVENQPLVENPETRRLLKPENVWEIEGSTRLSATDVSLAAEARGDWYRTLNGLYERYDLLALPSAQVFAFPAEVHWPREIAGRPMDTYHRWMEVVIGGSLAGAPVVSLPVGFDANGRAMGMQFQGPTGEDRRVLEFAMAYESVTDFLGRRPLLRERP